MKKHRTYKWMRGLLQASAFTSVMFIMQACYGTPNNAREREDMIKMDVYGKVVDGTSMQPVKGISVSSGLNSDEVRTNENGEFVFSAYSYYEMDNIEISFYDYEGRYSTLDTLVPHDGDSLDIRLSQRN